MSEIKDTVIDRTRRIWKIITEPIEFRYERDMLDTEPVLNPRRRRLSEEDVASFMDSVEHREDPLWESIENFIRGPLWLRSPTRSRYLQREIRWMRRMAARDGLEWGLHD